MRLPPIVLFAVVLSSAQILAARPASAQTFRGDVEDYLKTRPKLGLSDERFLKLFFERRFASNPEIDSRDCRFQSKKIVEPSQREFAAKKWVSGERLRGRLIFGAKLIDRSVLDTIPGVDVVEREIDSFDALLTDLQIRHAKGAPFERSIIHFNLTVIAETFAVDRAGLMDGLKRAGIPRELADFPKSAPEKYRDFFFFHDPIPSTTKVSSAFELEYEELFVKCAGRAPPSPASAPKPIDVIRPADGMEPIIVPSVPETPVATESEAKPPGSPITEAVSPPPIGGAPVVYGPRPPRAGPAPVIRATVRRMPRNPNQRRTIWECLPFVGESIRRAKSTACPSPPR